MRCLTLIVPLPWCIRAFSDSPQSGSGCRHLLRTHGLRISGKGLCRTGSSPAPPRAGPRPLRARRQNRQIDATWGRRGVDGQKTMVSRSRRATISSSSRPSMTPTSLREAGVQSRKIFHAALSRTRLRHRGRTPRADACLIQTEPGRPSPGNRRRGLGLRASSLNLHHLSPWVIRAGCDRSAGIMHRSTLNASLGWTAAPRQLPTASNDCLLPGRAKRRANHPQLVQVVRDQRAC